MRACARVCASGERGLLVVYYLAKHILVVLRSKVMTLVVSRGAGEGACSYV